jgi:hypothetical protein
MKDVLEDIQSKFVMIESMERDTELEDLNSAMSNLEAALTLMEKLGKRE